MLTLNGAVSNCPSLGAGDANVGYRSSHPHSRLPHLHAYAQRRDTRAAWNRLDNGLDEPSSLKTWPDRSCVTAFKPSFRSNWNWLSNRSDAWGEVITKQSRGDAHHVRLPDSLHLTRLLLFHSHHWPIPQSLSSKPVQNQMPIHTYSNSTILTVQLSDGGTNWGGGHCL